MARRPPLPNISGGSQTSRVSSSVPNAPSCATRIGPAAYATVSPARVRRLVSPTCAPTMTRMPAARAADNDARETSLADVVQLTRDFDRAGEAYFSRDMNWIVFQATPKGEKHYAMYVARLDRQDGRIVAAGTPTRISPPNSRNTCGFFSPDGESLTYTYDTQAERSGITRLLTDLAAADVRFRDLETSENSLEEIFVSLVKERS